MPDLKNPFRARGRRERGLLLRRGRDLDRHRLGVCRLDLIALRDELELFRIANLEVYRALRSTKGDRLCRGVEVDDVGHDRHLLPDDACGAGARFRARRTRLLGPCDGLAAAFLELQRQRFDIRGSDLIANARPDPM